MPTVCFDVDGIDYPDLLLGGDSSIHNRGYTPGVIFWACRAGHENCGCYLAGRWRVFCPHPQQCGEFPMHYTAQQHFVEMCTAERGWGVAMGYVPILNSEEIFGYKRSAGNGYSEDRSRYGWIRNSFLAECALRF